MTDTPETLQSALADLTRRVAAFELAQATKLYGVVAAQEPPMLTEEQYTILLHDYHSMVPGRVNQAEINAGLRLRYVEAELARLREENAALRRFVEVWDAWEAPRKNMDDDVVCYRDTVVARRALKLTVTK